MTALGEEVDEPATDLCGGQRHDPRIGDLHGWWHRGNGSEPLTRAHDP
jgi:hypothetical protein